MQKYLLIKKSINCDCREVNSFEQKFGNILLYCMFGRHLCRPPLAVCCNVVTYIIKQIRTYNYCNCLVQKTTSELKYPYASLRASRDIIIPYCFPISSILHLFPINCQYSTYFGLLGLFLNC